MRQDSLLELIMNTSQYDFAGVRSDAVLFFQDEFVGIVCPARERTNA
jgi:hypothetical protein